MKWFEPCHSLAARALPAPSPGTRLYAAQSETEDMLFIDSASGDTADFKEADVRPGTSVNFSR